MPFCVYTVFAKKTITCKGWCLIENSIYHSMLLYNCLKKLNLCRVFPQTAMNHIMVILISIFSLGYHGKPIFCIMDDTISSQTKPSSRALHPIEDAYFHQSHLKGKQDYGYQAVAVMLSCNGIVMYDKSKSKVKIVQETANELPVPPVVSYFLCDSWYTCGGIMDAFIKKGFYTIGALKTNWIVYLWGIKQRIGELAFHLRKTDSDVSLVTAGSRSYYVYRYEGSLNGIDDAVVLISYPTDVFHAPKALWAFISTDVSLSTREILENMWNSGQLGRCQNNYLYADILEMLTKIFLNSHVWHKFRHGNIISPFISDRTTVS